MLFAALMTMPEPLIVTAQEESDSFFSVDNDVLALWKFDQNNADVSGNGRDGVLLGGEFVETPFGTGLQVGTTEPTGLDWSEHANLLIHPYTIEMILLVEDTSAWRKIFSFDDANDQGWYYRNAGIQSLPNPELGSGQLAAQTWMYLTFVSVAPDEIEVYSNGELLGRTPAGFEVPPAQALFFRDDSASGRGEQVEGVVEELRISRGTRVPQAIVGLNEQGSVPNSDIAQAPPRSLIATIPTPAEVEFTPEVVGANIGLALLLALGFGFTSTLFNSTLQENEAQFQAGFYRRIEPLHRLIPRRLRPPTFPSRWKGHWLFTLSLLLGSALIYAFLDPTFAFNAAGMALFFALFLSIAIVAVVYDLSQGILAHRYFGRTGSMEAFPVALLIAIGCVMFSRLLNFQPGYLLGFVAAFVLSTDPTVDKLQEQRQNALLILAGTLLLLFIALIAWSLTGITQDVPILGPTLALIFVAGLEGVMYVLMPLEFLDGSVLYSWNKYVWFATFVVATYWFCQILLNPNGSFLEAFAKGNVQLMIVILILYILLTALLWWYARYYLRDRIVAEQTSGL